MELCSMLCDSLDGREVWGRMDTCICSAESLHCSPETITTLFSSYTPIQNVSGVKKINLKKHKYVISPGQSSPKQISRGYMRSAHTSDIRSWRCQHRKSSWAFPVGNCEVCRDNGCGKPQFFLFFFNIYWAAPGLSWGTGDLQFLLLHVEL